MTQLQILAVLLVCIAVAHWFGRQRYGQWLGSALWVIVLTATVANLGVIPLASEPTPIYTQLLGTAAPISIFLLLLKARLRSLVEVGLPLGLMFAFAALGTLAGVLIAGYLLGASEWMAPWYAPLAGMFAATYIGGGANFNAVALHFGVMESGNLYAAAVVADHVLTVVWIALLLLFPRLVGRWLTRRDPLETAKCEAEAGAARTAQDRRPDLGDLVMLLALGVGAFVLSDWLAARLAAWTGLAVPPILILTTLALILAQFEAVARLKGGQILGMFGAYLFLAALATYCELSALASLGWLGLKLMAYVTLIIAVHALVVLLAGRLLRQSPETVAVASATTVGGATVVLPLVERFERPDLLLPGIALGTLGNLLGTYVGFSLVYALS
ncbi:DUF819 family protein [Wenzhouxiangella marina]|uniref:Uncharacterized protein n=1 Tax=Wenzhouxiangella marina TaxID=1579979 RepID=A0A0K0XUK2_9GAMM|nr:DUF819 family protein [Wenzhouxiangella marina]AKS41394.1 hypothetical protein WM2015_1017 [Wenzhouxiangella marina]MBB6086852.1 putative membrane protein [Wenzhouxiangella marina]